MGRNYAPFSSLAEITHRRLLVVDALFAEWGHPGDALEDVVGQTDRVRGRDCHTEGVTGTLGPAGGLFPPDYFVPLAQELCARSWNLEQETVAGRHQLSGLMRFLPIYCDGSSHAVGFVLAPVGQPVGARLFPLTYPADIVDFGLTQLRPAGDGIRFFSELTGIYSDAVRLSGQFVGVRAELLTTLGQLAGVLRDLVGRAGLQIRDDAERERDGYGDPRDKVFHSSPDAADAGAHSVGDAPVADSKTGSATGRTGGR